MMGLRKLQLLLLLVDRRNNRRARIPRTVRRVHGSWKRVLQRGYLQLRLVSLYVELLLQHVYLRLQHLYAIVRKVLRLHRWEGRAGEELRFGGYFL